VGTIGLVVPSPVASATLALASVGRPHADAGSRVELDAPGDAVSGTIVPTPLYDPERRRVRS